MGREIDLYIFLEEIDMIIKVTDRCERGCNHCMFNCTKDGSDMSFEMFESRVGLLKCDSIIISGGEPMLHPEIERIILHASKNAGIVRVLTSGVRLDLLSKIIKSTSNVLVQITNDKRYYPVSNEINSSIRSFVKSNSPFRFELVERIGDLVNLGRAKIKSKRQRVGCVNGALVAIQKVLQYIRPSINNIERELEYHNKRCIFNVGVDGSLYLGECSEMKLTDFSHSDWMDEVLYKMMNYEKYIRCDKCGISAYASLDTVLRSNNIDTSPVKDTFKGDWLEK